MHIYKCAPTHSFFLKHIHTHRHRHTDTHTHTRTHTCNHRGENQANRPHEFLLKWDYWNGSPCFSMSIITHYAIGDKSIYFPSGFRSNYSCILQRTRRRNAGCLTGLVNNMLGCLSEFNMRCQLRVAGVWQVSHTDKTTTFRSASTMICISPRETLTYFCVFVCQARSTSLTPRTSGNVEKKIYLGFLKNSADYFQFFNFVHTVNFVCMHLQQLIEKCIEMNELLTDNLPNYVRVRHWYNLIYCCLEPIRVLSAAWQERWFYNRTEANFHFVWLCEDLMLAQHRWSRSLTSRHVAVTCVSEVCMKLLFCSDYLGLRWVGHVVTFFPTAQGFIMKTDRVHDAILPSASCLASVTLDAAADRYQPMYLYISIYICNFSLGLIRYSDSDSDIYFIFTVIPQIW